MNKAAGVKPGWLATWRSRALGMAVVLAGLWSCVPVLAHAFAFADVVDQARTLAAERYVAPVRSAPESLTAIDYATYQSLRHKPEAWIWRDSATPFRIELHHVGMQYSAPVELNIIDSAGVTPVRYDPAQFDFGTLAFDPATLDGSGIAGFQVRFPASGPESRDSIASFLGASYFHMLGAGQVPGTTARGLAVDTGLASGEQFPWFRKFWLMRPGAGDKHLTLFALLDSPGVTGAYRFVIHPGAETAVEVRAQLFFRNAVGKLGLAPLTSMFLYGGGGGLAPPDAQLRPEVHDADGLAIVTASGERIWRPLNNPRRLAISAFRLDNPRGFGLLQRAREFNRYDDLEQRFDLRPSVWVEPQGDWGPGHVELVEIPSQDETNDNVVVFWVPATQPAPGEALNLAYRLLWSTQGVADSPALAVVRQTRRAPGSARGNDMSRKPDGTVKLHVDFAGEVLRKLPDGAVVTVDLSHGGNAEILQSELKRHPVYQGYRLVLRVKPVDTTKPVELRARLLHDNQPVSEVWSYQIPNG